MEIIYETLTLEEGALTVSSEGLRFVGDGRSADWDVKGIEVRDWKVVDGTIRVNLGDDGKVLVIDLWTGSEGARPEFAPSRGPAVLELIRSKTTWRRRPVHTSGIEEGLPFLRKGCRIPSLFEGPGGRRLAISCEIGGSCADVFSWNEGHYASVNGVLIRFDENLSTVWERCMGISIREVLPVGDKLLVFGNEEIVSITSDNRVEWTNFVDDPSLVRIDGGGRMVLTDWRRVDHIFDPVTGWQLPPESEYLRHMRKPVNAPKRPRS